MIDPDGLNVWYSKEIVGYLRQNAQGQMSFAYDQDWLENGFSISCTLPLQVEEFAAQEGVAHRFFANLLAGNSDAHAKNLSLLYSPQGIRLAPFYDLICTRAIERIDYHLAMAVATERNPSLVTQKHWNELAQQCGLAARVVSKQVETMAKKLLAVLPECRHEFNQRYCEYPALIRIEQVVKKQCTRVLANYN